VSERTSPVFCIHSHKVAQVNLTKARSSFACPKAARSSAM